MSDWWHRDATWWQFWMPGSGPVGGVFAGAVLTIIVGLAIAYG